MASYITTCSGKHLDPVHPDPDAILIEDIAHALSYLCRGNGHVKQFLSVGQHCLRCALEAEARNAAPRLILACLLHDAGEAYLSDVPRPFKQVLPDYIQYEEKLLSIIYEKFLRTPLTEEEALYVKQIDDDVLYYDLKILLNEVQEREAPEMAYAYAYEQQSFKEVEEAYLCLYQKFIHMI